MSGRFTNLEPPNYPLIYPKYPLLRAIRTPLKGHGGVLVQAFERDYGAAPGVQGLGSGKPGAWALTFCFGVLVSGFRVYRV